MQRRSVRTVYRWQEEGERWDLVIDLLVAGDHIVNDRPFIGWVSQHQGGIWPFILERDGTIDFGSDWEQNERYHRTNLRERPIRIGELMTVFEPGEHGEEESVYRCVQVETMVAGPPSI